MNIYIYKSQSNLPNRLQLYKIGFLIGYKSICKVDIRYKNYKRTKSRKFEHYRELTLIGSKVLIRTIK